MTKNNPAQKGSHGAADRSTPLLRERVKAIFRQFPGALGGDPDAVHDLRVATRRLRVALPLVAANPQGRRVQRILRVLRRLTRAAGASRDFDVALDTYDAHQGERSPEWLILRRRLRAARGRARHRMADALLDIEIARLRRDLRVVLARRGEGLFVALRRLHDAREALGTEALGLLEALGGAYDAPRLHRVRNRLRRLRYAAEVADVMRGSTSGAPAAFKLLQDDLGALHDAHVLAEWLTAQARSGAARGQQSLAAEARALASHFQDVAQARHRAFLDAHPREAIQAALSAMAGGSRSVVA